MCVSTTNYYVAKRFASDVVGLEMGGAPVLAGMLYLVLRRCDYGGDADRGSRIRTKGGD